MREDEQVDSIYPIRLAMSVGSIDTWMMTAETRELPATPPFIGVLDNGTAAVEKVLVISRDEGVILVGARGYDHTVAQAHLGEASEAEVRELVTHMREKRLLDTPVEEWVAEAEKRAMQDWQPT